MNRCSEFSFFADTRVGQLPAQYMSGERSRALGTDECYYWKGIAWHQILALDDEARWLSANYHDGYP